MGFEIVRDILLAFLVCIWIRVILSYFPLTPGSPVTGLARVVGTVTDPVLMPVRRVLPPLRLGAGAIDLSPMVVTVVIIILMDLL